MSDIFFAELAEYGPDCDDPSFINILRASYVAEESADDSNTNIVNHVIEEHFTKATFIVIWAVWMGLVLILCVQCRRLIASQRQMSFSSNLQMVKAGDKQNDNANYNPGLPMTTDRAMTDPDNAIGEEKKQNKI